MGTKRFKKLVKKISKLLPKQDTSMKKKLKIIDKWYPGPQGLSDEEVLMYGDFDSDHDFQFFVASLRKANAKMKDKNPEFSELIDSDLGGGGNL